VNPPGKEVRKGEGIRTEKGAEEEENGERDGGSCSKKPSGTGDPDGREKALIV